MHQYQNYTLIQEHIAHWKTSGLTQVAYCQQHAIAENQGNRAIAK